MWNRNSCRDMLLELQLWRELNKIHIWVYQYSNRFFWWNHWAGYRYYHTDWRNTSKSSHKCYRISCTFFILSLFNKIINQKVRFYFIGYCFSLSYQIWLHCYSILLISLNGEHLLDRIYNLLLLLKCQMISWWTKLHVAHSINKGTGLSPNFLKPATKY